MSNISLDLSLAPSVLFLFGLVGSGKSYVGDLIGKHSGRHVYHADDDLTGEMRLALAEKRPFTNDMRDSYFHVIAKKIPKLYEQHGPLIITQGAYKRQHRDLICRTIKDVEMIYIDAPSELILERLIARNSGVSNASAAALRRDFELPPRGSKTIFNQGDDAYLISQFADYYTSGKHIR